jgi:RNA polymerase sigma-70 factor (ECF subfamily)
MPFQKGGPPPSPGAAFRLPARRSEDVLETVVVAEAFKALSRPHREILTETVMRNRTVNEAADILGVPLATAKTRVYYALRALRIVLEERGVTTT